jgi:hypothetical protein
MGTEQPRAMICAPPPFAATDRYFFRRCNEGSAGIEASVRPACAH